MTCVFKAQLDGKTSVLMFSLVTNSKHPLILVLFGLLVQKYKQFQTVSWACDGLPFGFRTASLDQILSSPKPGSMTYTPFCGPKCTPSYSIQKYFKDVLTASFTIFSHFPPSVLPFILSPSHHHSSLFLSAAHMPQTSSTRTLATHTIVGHPWEISDSCFLKQARDYIWVTM